MWLTFVWKMNLLRKCNTCKAVTRFSSHLFSTSSKSSVGFSFELNDNQKILKDKARKFARDEILPIASQFDKTGEFPWDIIKKSHKLGLMNHHVPKELGGIDREVFDTCLISEELAYACLAISLPMYVSTIAQIPLIIAGNDAQKKKYLGRLIDEPLLAAFCVTEPVAGSDVSGIKSTAYRKGDEYILNGQKIWITNAGVANWYFILARTNPNPKLPASECFTGFIVDRDTPGITPGRKEWNMGQRASDTRGIIFEDVRIPVENVILGEGAGFKIVLKCFDISRPVVAASSVGLANRALDEAIKFSLETEEFNEPIASQQAIAFMIADMVIRIETSRLLWQKSAWLTDQGKFNSLLASAAKVYASEMANKCASDAVQIFGNNGYSENYPVAKLMRDAKILEIYEGTSQMLG